MPSTVENIISQKEIETNGRFKIKKASRMLLPIRFERAYFLEINKQILKLIDLTKNIIFPELPKIERDADVLRPKTDSNVLFIKNIDFSDLITETIASTRFTFDTIITDQQRKRIAEQVSFSISGFNKKQVNKVLKSMIGVDLFFDDSFLTNETTAFVDSNISLIKSIDERYFTEIEEIIFRGARQGVRHEEIRKEISSRFSVARNRAKLIARDQINKFNGQLTKLRQESVGVKEYIWRTSLDERVRGNPTGRFPRAVPSHWDREGKKFKWEKPPSDGHPGEPIQCRCYAEPVLEGLIDI